MQKEIYRSLFEIIIICDEIFHTYILFETIIENLENYKVKNDGGIIYRIEKDFGSS